jgi:hypothetical protein
MAFKDRSALIADAEEVRDEVATSGNTATRVGTMLRSLGESLQAAGRQTLFAADFIEAGNSEWAVNGNVPLGTDSNDQELEVRLLSDTAMGLGAMLRVPLGATNLVVTATVRAESAPAGARAAVLAIYGHGLAAAWSTKEALGTVAIPASEAWVEDTFTVAIADIDLTAGDIGQIEIIRDYADAADTLADDGIDLTLAAVTIGFS